MASANHPHFDIQIGKVRFSEQKLLSGDGTLLNLVKSITINKNLDKTATKGKRKVKVNQCDVVLTNVSEFDKHGFPLDNLLRLGRKVKVWLGYQGEPLIRVGVYTLCNPKWSFPRNGLPSVHFKAKAGDVSLMDDNRGEIFRDITVSDAIKKLAERHGLQTNVAPTQGKVTLLKTVEEDYIDAMYRWAYDVGYELTIDENTEPNTVVCGPMKETTYLYIGDRPFTTGWGPGTPASFPAASMEIEHTYPDPTVTGTSVTDTKKVAVSGSIGTVLVALLKENLISESTHSNAIKTINSGIATKNQMENKVRGAQAATQLSKVLTAVYDPGIPYFQLGKMIKVVGHGDLSRNYRLVDITHMVSQKGFTTQIKAMIGGNIAGNSAKDTTNVAVSTSAGLALVAKLMKDARQPNVTGGQK